MCLFYLQFLPGTMPDTQMRVTEQSGAGNKPYCCQKCKNPIYLTSDLENLRGPDLSSILSKLYIGFVSAASIERERVMRLCAFEYFGPLMLKDEVINDQF